MIGHNQRFQVMNNLCHKYDAGAEKGMNHTIGKADKMKENGMKSLKDW